MDYELTLILKLNKLIIDEETNTKISKHIKAKISVQNVPFYHSIAKVYNLSSVSSFSTSYIARCFTMVVDAQNFLYLDFEVVAKILKSSDLNIHTEVEVFNAAINWINNNIDRRRKYSKKLLSIVRLPLVSDTAFEYILGKGLSVIKNRKLAKELKEILLDQKISYQDESNSYYKSRYCNQNKFNLIIFGAFKKYLEYDEETLKINYQIDANDFTNAKVLPPMIRRRDYFEAVTVNGEVYVFGCSKIVEKYSPRTNAWSKVTYMFDNRNYYCCCAFMDDIFVIGGLVWKPRKTVVNTCLRFSTKKKRWYKVAGMKQARHYMDCAVYKGNVIVAGGQEIENISLKTVECYDAFSDKWSQMPDMINGRSGRGLLAVKNKLFAMNFSLEVYDDQCGKFVKLKTPFFVVPHRQVAIGSRIVVVGHYSKSVFAYDVDGGEWSEEKCEVTKDLHIYSCAKLPWY